MKRRKPKGARGPLRAKSRLAAISWQDLLVMVAPALLLIGVGAWLAIRFVRPAPPNTIHLIGGAEGRLDLQRAGGGGGFHRSGDLDDCDMTAF